VSSNCLQENTKANYLKFVLRMKGYLNISKLYLDGTGKKELPLPLKKGCPDLCTLSDLSTENRIRVAHTQGKKKKQKLIFACF